MRQQRPPNNPQSSRENRFKPRPKGKGKPFKKFQGPPKGRKPERRPPPNQAARDQADKPSNRAPEQTHREPAYLKELIEKKTRVVVRMRDNEEFAGTLEYYDKTFIRLTRGAEPNLFIFKHDIKYLYEVPVEAGAQPEEEPAGKGNSNEREIEPRAGDDDGGDEDDFDGDEYDDEDDEVDDGDDEEEDAA